MDLHFLHTVFNIVAIKHTSLSTESNIQLLKLFVGFNFDSIVEETIKRFSLC